MHLNFELLKKQHEFITSQERLVVFRAGIRGGKTHVLSIWGVIRALHGRKVIILEPTFGMVRDTLLPCIKEQLDAFGLSALDYTINLSSYTIKFRGGGEMLLRSAESAESIRGITADDGAIDEYAMLKTDTAYKILIGRLSKSENAQIRLTSSPSAFGWVKALEAKNCKVIHQTTLENYFLPASYIADMIAQYGEGSKWFRQEILGEFVALDDGIFDVSKIKRIPYINPQGRRFVRAWDTASSAKTTADYTASCLMSVDSAGNYIIHDITRSHGVFSAIQNTIISTMINDPAGCLQLMENTSAGQIIMSVLRADARLNGVAIVPVQPISDKITRALPLSGKVAAGVVSVCDCPMYNEFIDELESFGAKCPHDDMVDAASYAFNHITTAPARVVTFDF